jgi:hypothetical protein
MAGVFITFGRLTSTYLPPAASLLMWERVQTRDWVEEKVNSTHKMKMGFNGFPVNRLVSVGQLYRRLRIDVYFEMKRNIEFEENLYEI